MPERYRVTGIMSGSSMDGVDMAFCEFCKDNEAWDSKIIHSETIPYPSKLKNRLENWAGLEMDEIMELDGTLGEHFAKVLNDFHKRHGARPELIASHGHTLFHEPEKGITFQAGHGGIMADRTGVTVINDFRREDVEQGGQGAPLVPIGDRLLFGAYDACLNLGGFANISFEDPFGRRIAFDVGPANLALNRIAALEGLDFDRDGEMAAMGSIDQSFLLQLNTLEYYRQPPPKSLGKEWFQEVFIPHSAHPGLSPPDLMASMVEHIAIQLSSSVALACADSVLLTGGGALNLTLVERIRFHSKAEIIVPPTELVNFKEALIFAFLGLLRYRCEVNCLSSVTGGKTDLSAGIIHQLLKNK
ncbi:MAG: anhydro-N-acetylmuramic acid kinase [Bacteroidetes bacterium]|nr:anhydro-N-acetylmuramic acid kinase [Bacteroidota bacterium]